MNDNRKRRRNRKEEEQFSQCVRTHCPPCGCLIYEKRWRWRLIPSTIFETDTAQIGSTRSAYVGRRLIFQGRVSKGGQIRAGSRSLPILVQSIFTWIMIAT